MEQWIPAETPLLASLLLQTIRRFPIRPTSPMTCRIFPHQTHVGALAQKETKVTKVTKETQEKWAALGYQVHQVRQGKLVLKAIKEIKEIAEILPPGLREP
jgi:Fe-S-cluster containining protein